MREIKFRLIKDNKIVGYENHTINTHSEKTTLKGVIIEHAGCCVAGNEFSIGFGNMAMWIPHDLKVQYTGLKDKNGKEIYEGDIVMCDIADYTGTAESQTQQPCEVYFRSGGFLYRQNERLERLAYTGFDTVEVIGNIYENPELLENK